MARPTQGYSKHDDRNVWNQRTDDYKSSDKESDAIFEAMTGSGLISSENGKKNGGNNRNPGKKYS